MIRSHTRRRLLWVLVALLGLNIVSWLLMTSASFEGRTLGAATLALAFVKVRLIVIHYMEVGLAPRPVRVAFESWVFLVAAITITLYLR